MFYACFERIDDSYNFEIWVMFQIVRVQSNIQGIKYLSKYLYFFIDGINCYAQKYFYYKTLEMRGKHSAIASCLTRSIIKYFLIYSDIGI